ncbi:hypothetical protein ACFV2X_50040 [Streptomyces sp. NPDC059679]|uniref:hypothetical protein n=1 Tax=Streptomyces sp. NPDC059679 TaxID=3346903 RepID=UPI0036A7EA72
MSTELAVNGASPAHSSPQDLPELVLRFPAIRPRTWYRMAGIAHARGVLPATKFRLAHFLNEQRIDPSTGRIEGRWGTVQIDGGLTLAERYAYRYGVGVDRFWDDLKGLYRAGFAERVQAPAPGRRAVYALCLRADAIPSELPEDLMRELRVWDLPEAEDPFEDAQYGRLTSRPAGPVEPMVVRGENPETRQMIAEMAAAPRWEHPAGSKAALVAGAIREDAQRLERFGVKGMTPDLRCTAVADRDRAAEMTARIHRLMALGVNGKPSPLYARGFSQLDGFTTTGSTELSPAIGMGKTKTTPSAATGKKGGQAFGEDLGSVAWRVQRRVWHSWRAQLGRGEVFLPSGSPEERSRSLTGDAWSDLHHTITIALRRSTESELVELLTSNIVRYDRWGRIEAKAQNVGRLAGWRLWRLINSRKNAHGYGPRREIRVAAHVEAWDEATPAERDRIRARAQEARELHQRQELARAEQALAERAERRERWGLHRFEQPEVRSWTREPEHVHQEAEAARQQIEHRSAETTYRAAVARAHAEKRARQARGGQ